MDIERRQALGACSFTLSLRHLPSRAVFFGRYPSTYWLRKLYTNLRSNVGQLVDIVYGESTSAGGISDFAEQKWASDLLWESRGRHQKMPIA